MPAKTDRIEARVAPEQGRRIRYAAELAGASVSSFMVEAAAEKAERVLVEHREAVVPVDYFDRLIAALDEPPATQAALERGAARAGDVVQAR